jgi:hypothetical protein
LEAADEIYFFHGAGWLAASGQAGVFNRASCMPKREAARMKTPMRTDNFLKLIP